MRLPASKTEGDVVEGAPGLAPCFCNILCLSKISGISLMKPSCDLGLWSGADNSASLQSPILITTEAETPARILVFSYRRQNNDCDQYSLCHCVDNINDVETLHARHR